MACSLIWAGWYRGFARQSKAKENQALYRFASKALAASIGENPNLNPKLDLISVDERATGVRTYTLRESEDVIATTRVEPDPGLMEALFATKKVVGGMGGGFKTELDVEQEAILVHSPKVTVRATRENTGTIRWGASWTWAGKGRQRTWKVAQYKAIARYASMSSCCLYTADFPRCELHAYQLLATMDHAEIEFQLKAIFDTIDRLENSAL